VSELSLLRNSFERERQEKEQLHQAKKDLDARLASLIQAQSQLQDELKQKTEGLDVTYNEKIRLASANKDLESELEELKIMFEQATKAKSEADKVRILSSVGSFIVAED
jgi:multidrug efflux pump subunit AcrA (membrane-fusion protein)